MKIERIEGNIKLNIRNMNFKVKNCKNSKGITLIALVTTIILLIILAGTTLALLMGENGLMTKAKDAREESKISRITEKLELEKGPVQLNNDGKVTLDTYLEQVIKDGIITESDIEETGQENARYITVEGEYVYLVEDEENGNVKITYQGKLQELVPTLIIQVTSTTTNSITVKAGGNRIETYEFYIKNIETGEEYSLKETNTTGEYIFSGLEENKEYQIQVKATNKNGSTTRETEPIKTVPLGELTTTNTTFTYSPSGWTNQSITVTANSNITIPIGAKIQTSKDLNTWIDDLNQTYTENGYMYVRIWDGVNESEYAMAQISKIDKTLPIVTETTPTTNAVKIAATDEASGIIGYAITTDETIPTRFTECENTDKLEITINALRQSTTYYVWVKDEAGNISKAKQFNTESVIELTTANTTFTYSPTGWTNQSITVTASTTVEIPEGYILQTSKDANTWSDEKTQVYIENGEIYARLYDGINESSHAAGEISKIDKDAPTTTIELSTENTFINATITATVTISDSASGVDTTKCKYVYNTTETEIGTTDENAYTYDFTENPINLSVDTIGTYYLHVLATDAIGNKSETISSAITVKDSKVISNLEQGDYIYYDPGSRSYTSPSSANGMSNQTFSSGSYKGTWRVLTKTSSAVTIIPTFSISNFQVQGQTGYNNFISELNKISAIYVHPTYATSARIVAYSDVSTLTSIGALNIGKTYWLGDRFSEKDSSGRTFYYARTVVSGGNVQNSWVYYVSKSGNVYTDTPSFQVRPVITLKSDAPLEKGTGTSSDMYYLR